MKVLGIRGSILHFLADPFYSIETESFQYLDDGLMVIENGKIKEVGEFSNLEKKYSAVPIEDYRGFLVLPGFIDSHIHYPQTEMIASPGDQLLDWLDRYTFPVERKFQRKEIAEEVSRFFLDELLRNGTTTALVFGTVHKESVEALFEEAFRRNQRIISGKVLMDRPGYAPDYLKDTAECGHRTTLELIQNWHQKGRLLYAVTPRFAITSTPEQLKRAGWIMKECPGVYLQTHLSENKKEIETVSQLYPERKNYLDVYDHFDLLGPTSVFAHCIHLSEQEFSRLSETRSSISFCPTSNLFLGSGLFQIGKATDKNRPIRLSLGTDVGGGTSFSMLQTMHKAYSVAKLQNYSLSVFKSLYLATLGGAKALSIDDRVGNFLPGMEADFAVLDYCSTPLQAFKMNHLPIRSKTENLHEKLFSLKVLGDDRAVKATYLMGNKQYQRT